MTHKPRQKIVLFGGSFDPIHNGHLAVAADAFKQLDADRLILVPARRSPHKTRDPFASDQARLTMIHLAIEGYESFEVSDCELRRSGPSYTLDTVLFFRQSVGCEAEIFWLVGADAVHDLHRWYRIDDLLTQCRVCVMYRGGMPKPQLAHQIGTLGAARVAQLEKDILATPQITTSSTDIRARLAAGQSAEGLLPVPVLAYIRRAGLYGTGA